MQRYKKIKINGRTVSLHRYVWEQANGPIPDGYIIHHKNGDRYDNRLENLEMVTHQEHSEHHNQKHAKTKKCVVCGGTFTPHPTKRSRAKSCSRECHRANMSRIAKERTKSPTHRKKLSDAAHRNGSAERARTLVMHRWHPDKG